ncbi:MAG: GntR family transcriptional regulator [Planctomycetota bacterium]|nr:GntR family transcriptional regulator [Planctomycetota bacterium]
MIAGNPKLRPRKTSALRRERKHDIVVKDIAAQVAAGNLLPGDRLASVNDLIEHYGVSQRAVLAALRVLAERGVIVKRQRRGCFIAPGAMAKVALPPAANSNANFASLSARFHAYLMPCVKKRTLCVYISDLFATNLAAWRQNLDEFSATHPALAVEMLSCHDGHLEEICQKRMPDMVLSTPLLLSHLGAGRFLRLDLDTCGIASEDLVPPVREYIQRTPRLSGVPYLLTVNYVYANLDLSAQAGLSSEPAASFAELMQRAAAVAKTLGPHRIGYATPGGMLDELFATGSVRIGENGELLFDAERCRHCLEAFATSRFQPLGCLETVPAFSAGRLAYLWHCSFTAVELAQTTAFRWTAWPAPVADDACLPGYLMLLAINAGTRQRDACLALLRYLLSLPAQKRLAALGGNLPVCKDAVFAADILARHRVPADTLQKALAYTRLIGMDEARDALRAALARFQPAPLEIALYTGKTTPAEAAEKLKVFLSQYRGQR